MPGAERNNLEQESVNALKPPGTTQKSSHTRKYGTQRREGVRKESFGGGINHSCRHREGKPPWETPKNLSRRRSTIRSWKHLTGGRQRPLIKHPSKRQKSAKNWKEKVRRSSSGSLVKAEKEVCTEARLTQKEAGGDPR